MISSFTRTTRIKDCNVSQIFEYTISLDRTKTLAAIWFEMANKVIARVQYYDPLGGIRGDS